MGKDFKKAVLTTMTNVLDNIVAGGAAGFAVDLVIPTVGLYGRIEIAASVIVLFFVAAYLRK